MITVRLYAERKQWSLDRAEAHVVRHPDHGKPDVIEIELSLGGALDAGQRQRLAEASTRCPVHRSLMEGVKVVHAQPRTSGA